MEPSKKEIIDVHLYDPSGFSIFKKNKRDFSFAEIFYCSNKDACSIFKEGGCVKRDLKGLGGRGSCPYGTSEKIKGFTTSASKFYTWLENIKTTYKEYLFTLNAPKAKVFSVGDYYYIPYLTLSWCWGSRFKDLFHDRFIKKTDLTVEVLMEILTYRPQAIMGGEISDYQMKDVPNLIKSVVRYSPELADLIGQTGLKIDLSHPSNVGRKAILQTLNPDVEVTIKKDRFFWDGKTLKALSKISVMNFLPGNWECVLTPNENIEVIVENEGQVNENTEFSN